MASTKSPKKTSHPSSSEMVNSAIFNLNDRKGSSVHAIKKYIVAFYLVDMEKQAPFIKKYLKSAVTSGSIIQTSGIGASGSFKLSDKSKAEIKRRDSTTSPKSKKVVSKKKPPKARSTSPKTTVVPKKTRTKSKNSSAKK